MKRYEEMQYEKKLEDIIVQLGQLMLDILLMSVKKVHKQHDIFKELLEPTQPQDIPF